MTILIKIYFNYSRGSTREGFSKNRPQRYPQNNIIDFELLHRKKETKIRSCYLPTLAGHPFYDESAFSQPYSNS